MADVRPAGRNAAAIGGTGTAGRRRAHRAAAGRVLAAGVSFSVMFGIVAVLAGAQGPTLATTASAVSAPPPSVVTEIRHLPAVAAGAPPPTSGGPAPQPTTTATSSPPRTSSTAAAARTSTQAAATATTRVTTATPATTAPPVTAITPPTTAYRPPVTVAPTTVPVKVPDTRTGASHP
ncbi:MAG TPA: hypothetical protein VHT97_00560 [Acidimicrobiales bacterium]|jgi:hypothetical protein|nr:hypothetical protein [Acidimicrobiales bacterium]